LEAELPGILAWAVKGCLEWQRRGLEPVEKVKTATEEYRKESDVIERFLEECTIKKLNAKVKASELYQEFKRWAEENGEPGMTGTAFGRRMTEKGFKKRKSMGYTCYQGIGLLSSREG
jgi:putative DNA primase/helicase